LRVEEIKTGWELFGWMERTVKGDDLIREKHRRR
jgi:hypothetical protein